MSADSFIAVPTRERGRRPSGAPQNRSRWGAVPLGAERLAIAGVLLALLAISVWLRTVAIHFYYWVDEGISVGIASHPLGHIPDLMRQDGSPPLYYLILHFWMSAFGRGEVATHVLSLVFALLSIPVAYWAGSSLFDRRTGLVAAILAATLPYLTTYAQETRMYALVALLSILVAASFVHAFVLGRRRYLPVFALSLVAAVYSHNWGLFLGVASGAGFLWCLWRRRAVRGALLRDGLIAFGAVAVLYAPWLPTLVFQAQHTGAPWDLPPTFWSLTQGLYFIVAGRGAAMVLLFAGGAGLHAVWRMSARGVAGAGPQAAAGPPSGAVARARAAVRDYAVAEREWTWLAAESLLILGLGAMLVAWVASKATPAWAPRYLAVVVGPLLLLFAYGLARAGRMGLIGLLLLAGFWLIDPVPHNVNTKSNVASVAAAIRPHLGSDPLVISTQPEQVPVISYYLPGVHRFATPLGPTADPRVVDWREALAKLERSSVRATLVPLLATLAPGQRVALVTPVNLAKAPAWMKLINRDSAHWAVFLAKDPALRRVTASDAKYFDAGVAVQAVVYERR
jgi:mannosyltransferase